MISLHAIALPKDKSGMYSANQHTNRNQLIVNLIKQSNRRRRVYLSALAFVAGWLALSSPGLAVCNEGCVGFGSTFLGDDTGAALGSPTINLPATGHTSFLLTLNYAVTAGKRGTVEFDTPPGGQISALGLRATPAGTLTTIPVLRK